MDVAISIDIQNNSGARSDNVIERQHFDVDAKKLSETVREKNIESLNGLGGVKRVAETLESNPKGGISGNDVEIARRRTAFGANRYIKPPPKGFLSFVIDAFKDIRIIILLVCAIFSLVFGIKEGGWKEGWYDGGSIIVAVVLVVSVFAVSNFKQNRQFEALSDESSDIRVEVVRDGRPRAISVFDVVVGDVVNLKIGDQIPADGLFLNGHSLKVDESSMTGESDHVEVNENNPFLLYGTKVTDGYGSMLVTSVGMSTAWGEMMSTVSHKLKDKTRYKLVSTRNTRDEMGNREFRRGKMKFTDVMNSVIDIVAASVTILVVAIPEGLPLAVTLSLAYSMKRMMRDNAMVRKLFACETMGLATTICTDKTVRGVSSMP